jgi:hypothetical protein
MEDQERIEGEEVEAHRRKVKYQAAEDAPDESEGEEVEAHRRKVKYQAAEDASEETEGEGDDVEAHQLRRPPTSGD